MRGGSIAILLTLLIGACPAHAQVGSVGDPNPAEQRPAVKKSRAAHKPVQKSVAKTKPTAAKPITAKPIATKPVAAKPVAAKPVATKPVAAKPVATKIAPVPVPKPEAAKAPAATATPAPPAELTSIPPAERLKIQAALYWAGDFSSEAAGDDALDAAIRSFQKRNKLKVTGALTPEQRATLVSAAASHEQEFGWTVVTDPATGVRIGLPGKLVPNTRDTAHGTRWSSPHGEVQVETFRIENTALATLFEQEKKASSRKIEHSALTEDGFIVSGMQGLKLFTVRARQRNGEIRGFTLLYDQMMEGIVAPVMVAMASAFSPFPERAAPFAALAKKVEYGTGLIVSAAGHILTASKVVHGCQVIVADNFGNAERVADDDANGLALLRVYGVHRLPALAFAGDAAKAGEITLVGIPDPKEQNGGRKLTEIKAKLADSAAIALRQPVPMAGFAGAAALDAQDRFVGIMETRNVALASSEPTLPPVRLIGAASIRDFLDSQHVPLAGAGTDARAALVRIICVRK
jgi:trypsin-like peptidase/putative peptidoglycan binding protein